MKWTAPVPGRGHGTPIVVGDRVYLTAADDDAEKQWAIAYDRETGKEAWRTLIHEGGFPEKMNSKASNASGSLACDGERLFVSFLHDKAVYTTALDLGGKQVWQTKITDYMCTQLVVGNALLAEVRRSVHFAGTKALLASECPIDCRHRGDVQQDARRCIESRYSVSSSQQYGYAPI